MPNTIKAEMWDRMQFLFRNYYDRMVHARLVYTGDIDLPALKNALLFMLEKAPVLHSSFVTTVVEPYWKEEQYTIDDVLSYFEVDNADKDADEWLVGVIPYTSNVQMKIALFKDACHTVFCLRVNHMCMDGGDLKYFLATLVENYGYLKNGEYDKLHIKSGSRSYDQVYSTFEGDDLKHARGLYKNIAKATEKVYFPWSEPTAEDKNTIVRRTIGEQDFAKLRQVSKKLGITVNDALMAATFRALYEMCGLKDDDPLTVSCAIDLRKHIKQGGLLGGMTNHTAWMAVRTLQKGDDIRDTVVNVIRSTKGFKRDKFMGLYSLPLLKLAYTIFPHDLAEFAIKAGYDNPLIAVSNMGLLDDAKLTFDGLTLTDGFISGAVKYKPFFLMSVTTLLGKLSLSTAIRGNAQDVEIANRFFDGVEREIKEFELI